MKEVYFKFRKDTLVIKKNSCWFSSDCSFYEPNVPEKIVILTIYGDKESLKKRKLNDKMKFEISSATRLAFKADYARIDQMRFINLYTDQCYEKHSIEVKGGKNVKIKKVEEKIVKDFLIGSF